MIFKKKDKWKTLLFVKEEIPLIKNKTMIK
jgi:hypothetical protein